MNTIQRYASGFVPAGVILLLYCSLMVTSIHAGETTDPLHRFLNDLDSLKSDFNQVMIGTNGDVLEEATGVLYMQSPGRFYWAYQSPYVQKIITNGQTLWIYDEDLEQVTIKDVSDSLDDTPAAILSGSENVDMHYQVVDNGLIEGLNMFELKPMDSENQFETINIGFYGKQLFLMIMHDNLGQTTRINFRNVERNAGVDSSYFEFVPPDNVDVIDDRSARTVP